MSAWNAGKLATIGGTDLADISVMKADGTMPKKINIWVVPADGRLFLRSYTATPGGWYATALETGRGRVYGSGAEQDVQFVPVTAEATLALVDQAYHTKYAGTEYEADMVSDTVRGRTIELVPISE